MATTTTDREFHCFRLKGVDEDGNPMELDFKTKEKRRECARYWRIAGAECIRRFKVYRRKKT